MSQKAGEGQLVLKEVGRAPKGHQCHCSPSVCKHQCMEPLPLAELPCLCSPHCWQGAPTPQPCTHPLLPVEMPSAVQSSPQQCLVAQRDL